MCRRVLPCGVSLYHVRAVPMEDRESCWFPWNWSYKWLLATIWVLEMGPLSLEGHQVLLITEQYLQLLLCVCVRVHVEVSGQLARVGPLLPTM